MVGLETMSTIYAMANHAISQEKEAYRGSEDLDKLVLRPDGRRFEGRFRADKQDGFAVYYDAQGFGDTFDKGVGVEELNVQGPNVVGIGSMEGGAETVPGVCYSRQFCCREAVVKVESILEEDWYGACWFTWSRSAEKYDGEWRNDKRHGFGCHTWHDGTKYE
eukprot:gene28200-34911_t